MTLKLQNLLQHAYDENASDLHVTTGIPPVYRVNGQLKQYGDVIVTAEIIEQMVKDILPAYKAAEFEEKGETDFNYSLKDFCRFRVNA